MKKTLPKKILPYSALFIAIMLVSGCQDDTKDNVYTSPNQQSPAKTKDTKTKDTKTKDTDTKPKAHTLRAAKPGFRVYPYLQKPASDTMTLVWFSEKNTVGTVRVDGKTYQSKPAYQKLLEYSKKEQEQEIKGLEKGSWLKANSNYKHVVDITGLTANKRYDYTVTQDGIDYKNTFKTAPTRDDWQSIRVIAFADSETEPKGRLERREWEVSQTNGYTANSLKRPGKDSAWDKKFGNKPRYGQFTVRYPLTQHEALAENMKEIVKQKPDLMMIAGDLVQGGGYQPAWDEFFRYFAGDVTKLGSSVPLVTALGNWETYAAASGGYGKPEDRSPVVISRNKYHVYTETTGDKNNPHYKNSYYRIDHGPLTILTLDSTKGTPDENTRAKPPVLSGELFSGNDKDITPARMSTDTQGSFTNAEYKLAFTKVFGLAASKSDLPNFNEGTQQWQWVEAQLKDARAKGQIIIAQWHHAAYSSGVHGRPPNFKDAPDNQSGVAMRIYTPMFEKYGVAAVISGHDEMFERSFVDSDNNGIGMHVYDVGVAADGLRGESYGKQADGSYKPHRFNTHTKWSATANEPETWEKDAKGVPQLKSGGLHYGHLQIDISKTTEGATLKMTPVYLFPILDSDYNFVKTERRVYNDVVSFKVDNEGKPVK